MVERDLLRKMLEILELPGLDIPSSVAKGLADRIVLMSTAWADAPTHKREAILAHHGDAILRWLEAAEPGTGRPAYHSRSSTWSGRSTRELGNSALGGGMSLSVGSDKRKQSLYFSDAMLQEIKDEAARLDRSLSWVVQRAWKMARLEIRQIPSVNDIDPEEAEEEA